MLEWVIKTFWIYDQCISYTADRLIQRAGITVGIAAGYGTKIQSTEWVRVRLSAPIQSRPAAHPSSCTVGNGSLPRCKVTGVWSWPYATTKRRCERKSTAKPLHPFWIIYRQNFAFHTTYRSHTCICQVIWSYSRVKNLQKSVLQKRRNSTLRGFFDICGNADAEINTTVWIKGISRRGSVEC